MRPHLALVSLLLSAASCLATSDDAESEPVPPRATDIAELAPDDLREEPALAEIELRLRRSGEHDGVWGPMAQRAAAGETLRVGEESAFMIALGNSSGCGTAMASTIDSIENLPASAAGFRHVWLASVRRGSSELGSLRLEAHWRQYVDRGDGLQVALENARTIVLPEGETHLVGAAGLASDDACPAPVLVELRAEVAEDPEFADRALTYDLWYERIDERGEPTRRRFQGGGLHGEAIAFRLPAVHLNAASSGGDDRELFVELNGEIQGRWRSDDAVAIRLTAERRTGIVEPGKTGSLGTRGQELFVVHPGQTIRMELPPMKGLLSAHGPVQAGEDGNHVDLEARFAGHQEALVLTVHGAD